MQLNKIIVCFCCVALTACGTQSTLFDRAGYTLPVNPGETPEKLLETASNAYQEYIARADELENATYYFDLPIVGLATATVAALYYGAHRDLIAGMGIGAGAIAVTNTMVAPRTKADVYRNGASAMTCVLDKGRPFANSRQTISGIAAAIKNLNDKIKSAREQLAKPAAQPNAAKDIDKQVQAYEEAKTNLAAAVAGANTAAQAASSELEAANNGALSIKAALFGIQNKVKSGLKSKPMSFGDAVAAISGAAATAAAQVPSVQDAQAALNKLRQPTPKEVTTEGAEETLEDQTYKMEKATKELAELSKALLDSVPAYKKATQEVSTCEGIATGIITN